MAEQNPRYNIQERTLCIGVDLGTEGTKVHYADTKPGEPVDVKNVYVPSRVAFVPANETRTQEALMRLESGLKADYNPDGDGVGPFLKVNGTLYVVGDAARDSAVKRMLGDDHYTGPAKRKGDEISDRILEGMGVVLESALKRVLKSYIADGGENVRVVVAVPNEVDLMYQDDLYGLVHELHISAGITDNVVRARVGPEAYFAGHLVAHELDSSQTAFWVADIGAGTTDLLVYDGVPVAPGDERRVKTLSLGGKDVTTAFRAGLKTRHVNISWEGAETVKLTLGPFVLNEGAMPKKVYNEFTVRGRPHQKLNVATELESASRVLVEPTADGLIQLGVKYEGEHPPEQVFLVGGPGQTEGLAKAIEKALHGRGFTHLNVRQIGDIDTVSKGGLDHCLSASDQELQDNYQELMLRV